MAWMRLGASVGVRSVLSISALSIVALAGCDARTEVTLMDGAVRTDAGVGADGAPPPPPPPPPGGCPAPAALECADLVASTVPLDVTGNTDAAPDSFGGSDCGRGGGTGVPDVAYHYVAPAAGRYDITTEGSDFDTVLSVRRVCAGDEISCNDDVGRDMVHSRVTVDLAACEAIVIVVDGFDASATGAVRLRVTARESACADAMDNDGDGATDCDDNDCFSVECAGEDWPADWQAFEWEVLTLTNEYRAMGFNCDTEGSFGPAGPLEMDAVIQVASRAHSLDMGEQDYFDHQSLDGRAFDDRMREVGFEGDSPWGENIAAGQRTAASVVDGWMESDGHCANIMNPSYRVIGIGYAVVESSSYGTYWTQNFAASH